MAKLACALALSRLSSEMEQGLGSSVSELPQANANYAKRHLAVCFTPSNVAFAFFDSELGEVCGGCGCEVQWRLVCTSCCVIRHGHNVTRPQMSYMLSLCSYRRAKCMVMPPEEELHCKPFRKCSSSQSHILFTFRPRMQLKRRCCQ